MPRFVYDLSSFDMVILLTVVLVGSAWFGTIFLRPLVRTFIRREAGANDIVGYLLSAHGVYFGILLGLLALSAYENFAAADAIVGDEAAKLATLYTDVTGYPEPLRGELQDVLRRYTHYVINEGWEAADDVGSFPVAPQDTSLVFTRNSCGSSPRPRARKSSTRRPSVNSTP